MSLKILIIGANGQLGNELERCFSTGETEIGPIPEAYADAVVFYRDVDSLDITDVDAVSKAFEETQPDIVINCAAFTNVDRCEANEALAFAVNAKGAENLAVAAEKYGAKLVHVSTDYVFPGTDSKPRVESDKTEPISAYGRTKLAGEMAVKANCNRYFIVRTAWLYGYVGKNFVKTMMALGKQHDEVSVVDDQLGNPTSANDLAYTILKLALTDNYGVYHATNEGTCSWADFAASVMGGASLDCEVIPVTSAQWKEMHPESADRPAFSSLENKHLADTIGNEMRPWQDALASYLDNYEKLAN